MIFTAATAIGIAGGTIGLGIIVSTLVLCYYTARNRSKVQATKSAIFTLFALTGAVFVWALLKVSTIQPLEPKLITLSGALACEFAVEIGVVLLLLIGTPHQVFTRRRSILMEKRRREERRRNPMMVVQVPPWDPVATIKYSSVQVVTKVDPEPQVEVHRPTRFEREEVI
jgi:hypothetical protein